MRPTHCKIQERDYVMVALTLEPGQTVCNECTNKYCAGPNEIRIDFTAYKVLKKEGGLPKAPEWCSGCKKESSIPIALILFNGKEGYALRCNHCKREYVVYKSAYDRKHIGFTNMKGKYVPPSKNGKTQLSRQTEKELYEKSIQFLVDTFKYTREEAIKLKAMWNKETEQSRQRFKKEEDERRLEYQNERNEKQIQAKVSNVSDGVKSGNIVWDKNARCLVNKLTGEIVRI